MIESKTLSVKALILFASQPEMAEVAVERLQSVEIAAREVGDVAL